MADLGVVIQELNGLPADQKAILTRVLRMILKDIRFGHPKGEQPDPMMNIGGGFFHTTTPSTPGTVFDIPHSFGRTPYLAWPVLLLDSVGSSDGIVTVARAADDKRMYFTASVGDMPLSLAVEG